MSKVHDISGVKVEFKQVPLAIVDDINKKFIDPKPPMVEIEGKGREEPNPNDPDYLAELDAMANKRGQAVIDSVIIMGVNLVDGIPTSDDWLDNLRFLAEMTGSPDLSRFDLDNKKVKEFVFKKYVVLGRNSYGLMLKETGVSEEGIEAAQSTFPGDETRLPDSDGGTEKGSKS